MMLALDVHYHGAAVIAAGVGFSAWSDARAQIERIAHHTSAPEPYRPGEFYKRELPYLLDLVAAVATEIPTPLEVLIVDAQVWLGPDRPGLGAHLFAALERPVVGVAKRAFRGSPAIPVLRGQSMTPLYVGAVGVEPARAAELVRGMHGANRIPTLLGRVDRLARALETPRRP
jgi:deoxyribonuclease V